MSAQMNITAGGRKYVVEFGSFTAMDARLFRDTFGVGLGQAFSEDPDLDIIAGILWLHRRKSNGSLTYEQVAESMTYDDLVESMDADEEDPEPDPEA